jgi:hypothetical protein
LPDLSVLRERLREYLYRTIPGNLELYNLYCTLQYGVDCLSLFLTRPSRLYHIVLRHQRGDIDSADLAFSIAFLSPLLLILGDPGLSRELLNLVKSGRDEEFLKVIVECIRRWAARGGGA